jgi:sterol desaturase/sphingolipid hydroxylase (fatty acid hydroxylase superfamily)
MGLVSGISRGGKSLARAVSKDATIAAVPVFFATMALEHFVLRRRNGPALRVDESVPTEPNAQRPLGYEPVDTATSLAMGVGNLAVNMVFAKATKPIDRWLYEHRLANLGKARLAFPAAILAWDFLYYWDHRVQHERRIFWSNHVAHHSSRRYNLSTALRQPWASIMMHWIFAPMSLAGYSPSQIARAGEINLLYQYWIHTEAIDRLPEAAEGVFNTASHHRVHHGANPQYLDRNYGGILIIWDRMFGTFEPEDEPVLYGLTKNIDTQNPVRVGWGELAQIVSDVRSASSWRERARAVVGPPGYVPERAAVNANPGQL